MSRFYELPGGAGIMVGGDRMTWVLAKIVKGLCWRECGTFLGPETEWTVRIADFADVIEWRAKWSIEIPSIGDISQRGTVLIAKGDGRPQECLFLWLLIVQGRHPYFVTTRPRATLHAGALVLETDFMKLAWPRATSRARET
jgi:hypothetical protein